MDDTREYVEAYLDKIQAANPSMQGDEAREVLRTVYDHVSFAAHTVGRRLTTTHIFTTLRGRFLADLESLSTTGLAPGFLEVLRDDPSAALFVFLNNIYSNTLDHVATVGGVDLLTAPPSTNEVSDLTADDELLINSSAIGKA